MKKLCDEVLELLEKMDFKIGDKVKVDMKIVKKFGGLTPPYLRLVRQAIKEGEGTVEVISIDRAGLIEVAASRISSLLGGVWVPPEALRKVK